MNALLLFTKFLAALAFILPCMSMAADPVIIGFDEGSPPIMYAQSGHPAGLYSTLVKAIFEDAEQPMVAKVAPFKRVLDNVDRGIWGAGGILKTPERLAKYDFSEYIFLETLVIYYAKDRPLKVARMTDLRGKRVGLLRGWSYGEAFDIAMKDLDIKVEWSSKDETNFRKLQMGRIDAVVVLEEVGLYLTRTGRYDDLERAEPYFRQNPSYIAFNKNAHQRPLLEKLNRSIARMRKSGEIDELIREYFRNPPLGAS